MHGMGNQGPNYSKNTGDLILQELTKSGVASNILTRIIFKEFLCSNLLSKKETELWNRLERGNAKSQIGKKMDYHKLREFFIMFIGDSLLFNQPSIWTEIDDILSRLITEIKNEAEQDDSDFELTFIAHSLGTILLSEYLKTVTTNKEHSLNKIITEQNVMNIFTLGSPLAIWSLKNGSVANAKPQIFKNPKNGVWVNILDDDDIIGYPLKPINKSYDEIIDIDYITEVGNFVQPSIIFSHSGYWKDMNVIKPIAKKLELDICREENGKQFNLTEYKEFIQSLINI
jgi:hypothetical protein